MKNPRIALIHATPVAIDPICNTFKRLWPQARVTNLLDDSLSADLAAAGQLDDTMVERFCVLARYVEAGGAEVDPKPRDTGILDPCPDGRGYRRDGDGRG